MKVTVIELTTPNHSSMLYNWVDICFKNNWKCNLIYSEDVERNIIKTNVKSANTCCVNSFFSLLGHLKLIVSSDVIVFNTVQAKFFTFCLLSLLPNKTILSIHNVNSWLQPFNKATEHISYSGKFRFVAKIFLLKRFLVKLIRKFILFNVDYLLVNSDNMRKYIATNYEMTKPVLVVPFSMVHKPVSLTKKLEKTSFNIVYPGVVNSNKKDYKYFIELAKRNESLNFILLGKIDRNDPIYVDVKKVRNIQFFESYIKTTVFDDIMTDADVIFSYVNVNYRGEVYGGSKDSGISYLMAEYGIPLIVNQEFENLIDLNKGTLYYQRFQDLLDVFEVVKGSEKYSALTSNIVKGRDALGISIVAKRLSISLGEK
ncbi:MULTISPECIES: hypothetical protein [unclassified Shewanella]|uniref:hypothetical protein n=1 Tax=unclassified Shewanella TaxID=196818 RepID=UPI00354DD334